MFRFRNDRQPPVSQQNPPRPTVAPRQRASSTNRQKSSKASSKIVILSSCDTIPGLNPTLDEHSGGHTAPIPVQRVPPPIHNVQEPFDRIYPLGGPKTRKMFLCCRSPDRTCGARRRLPSRSRCGSGRQGSCALGDPTWRIDTGCDGCPMTVLRTFGLVVGPVGIAGPGCADQAESLPGIVSYTPDSGRKLAGALTVKPDPLRTYGMA